MLDVLIQFGLVERCLRSRDCSYVRLHRNIKLVASADMRLDSDLLMQLVLQICMVMVNCIKVIVHH